MRGRGAAPDALVAAAARALAAPGARVAQVAAALGVGGRRLHRRTVAAVGYGPKTLARVARLRRLIAVTDIPAAAAFYAAAFGWAIVEYGPDYAGIRVGDREVGGLRRDPEVRAGGPLVIVYSADLEGSVAAVTEAGGTILRPIYSFPGGRRFHFADPAGNELAVWSEVTPPG